MSITAIVENDIIRLPVGVHLPVGTAVRLDIGDTGESASERPAGYFERTAGALAGEPMERPAQGETSGEKRVRLPLVPSRHPGGAAIGNPEIEGFLVP